MSNARLNWVLPTPGLRQRPLASVIVEGRVSAELPWVVMNEVAVPSTSLLIQDIDPGEWMFRGSVVDVDGKRSPPLQATLSVPFDPPSPLGDFTATLE